jgi:hypothetical protein
LKCKREKFFTMHSMIAGTLYLTDVCPALVVHVGLRFVQGKKTFRNQAWLRKTPFALLKMSTLKIRVKNLSGTRK